MKPSAAFRKEYLFSIQHRETYWQNQANHYVDWIEPWQTTYAGDFRSGKIEWFSGGKLNVCANCIDRHLEKHANKAALIWEGDEPNTSSQLTYRGLYERVCRFANVLKSMGVKKGDTVCLYMPMILDAPIAMLACARIGAIHSVVFAGFSAQALADRLENAKIQWLITADINRRGGKQLPLKENVDLALSRYKQIQKVLVVKTSQIDTPWQAQRDIWLHDIEPTVESECPPEVMDAEDPLFILYTSGSTGKPKGVCHTSAGYLLYAAMTHHRVFDLQADDVYWCTADVGWITGHSYIVYGPLANASTVLIYEGIPSYPDNSRLWQVIDKHEVSIFYTAPTALRSLMRAGDDNVRRTSRESLRVLGSVGEPINPEVWRWYHNVVGNGHCPIVDTWWQTETGGILITPLAGETDLKPGSATLPFFGVEACILDDNGQEIVGVGRGRLAIKYPWPGIMRTVYGDHQRFIDTYLSTYPGYFFTGDGARRDEDGYYWITGRMDDVINVSGHRLGTAEIESALVSHDKVSEVAVVGIADDIKGQGIYAFVTLMQGETGSDELKTELAATLRKSIGPIAKCDYIQWTSELPKTRSGKIMRRILRKIASGEADQLGDTSTLADPSVVENIIENCQIRQ